VVEDLDAVGDGRDHEVLVGVPDEGLVDVPGPQQIDTGQLRVPPVPRPLP
jgi:hypothetical protein